MKFFYTTKEVASLLRCSTECVISMINNNEIDAIRTGRRWKIYKSKFDEKFLGKNLEVAELEEEPKPELYAQLNVKIKESLLLDLKKIHLEEKKTRDDKLSFRDFAAEILEDFIEEYKLNREESCQLTA